MRTNVRKFRLTLTALTLVALLFVVFGAAPVWAATPIYVDASRPDDSGDGTGWATAKKTIQAGIDAVDVGGTVNVAAGAYNESVTINKNNLIILGQSNPRPEITGGLKFDTNLTGLTLKNFTVKGNAVVGQNSVVRMFGAITDLTIENCVFDGENVAGRLGFSGGQLEGNVTITDSEFKRILGWAVLDSRSGSGGDGSAMDTVTFADNYIHDSNGSIVFRGLSTDRTDEVNAYGNTWDNIGGNAGQQGEHWAALEVNRAVAANVRHNTVSAVSQGQWGEGQAFQLWDIDTLYVYDNILTNNYQGIFIFGGGGGFPGGPFAVPGGSISFNNIVGNNQYGISVDPDATGGPLDAENNWWGDASGPTHAGNPGGTGDAVSDNVDYDPWAEAAVQEADAGNGVNASAQTTNASAQATGGGADTTVVVAEYAGEPTGVGGFATGASYVDVQVSGTLPTQLIIEIACPGGDRTGMVMRWFDGATWQDVAPQVVTNGTIRATLNNVDSTPLIAQLAGTPFGVGYLPEPVGGTIVPVSKLELLAPWMGLAALMAVAVAAVALNKRRA